MLILQNTYNLECGRAPRGARGLKSVLLLCDSTEHDGSCPSRGTWIEIESWLAEDKSPIVVPLAGHVD